MPRLIAGIKHLAVLLLGILLSQSVNAAPERLQGVWYVVNTSAITQPSRIFLDSPLDARFPVSKDINLTGGHYLHIASIDIKQSGDYVLDFKNTTTIGHFRHQLYDAQNKLILSLEGGVESNTLNPFFLRHGREVTLDKGRYTIATELVSANYLALPEPYIDEKLHYQQDIKSGNVVTLIGLGVFLGLGIYYAALAMSRNRWAEAMYAGFILGNLIFNSAALLVLADIFGIHSILWVSMPILFSNIAYIVFVIHLLEIKSKGRKILYRIGIGLIAVMLVFLGFSVVYPNWALELCRYGVTMFLSYGLLTAISESMRKNPTAKRYLVAISLFFVMGLVTVSLSKLDHHFTLYIEHMGLVSVAIEVVLLALVLAFQFSQLKEDKDKALVALEMSVRTALSDALTGLPNRHALVKDVVGLPVYGSLTFIDLDGLKIYNDTFGHARGDDLLCHFAHGYQKSLGDDIKLYRLGGDEFAAVSLKGNISNVESALEEALEILKRNGFEFAGASFGHVYGYEAENIAVLMRIADTRMYENKRARKQARAVESKSSFA